ncbi:MAG: hypothetical protein H6819_10070 [Phycisphaerales bacterium]|nr:hypothetical protein [Phycisphaerales bacterium]MCB9857995.1 hypothetical protein [Phycisphaerales bacterium]
MKLVPHVVAILLSLASSQSLRAGFVFHSLDLANSVHDYTGATDLDSDFITTATNPLNQTSLAQIGANIVESTYAFQWDGTLGTGTFATSLSHTIRSPDVETVTRVQIFIEPTEDLRVFVDGALTYNHTPNQEVGILYGMSVRNFTTSVEILQEVREGGNFYNDPSSGTFTISNETILQAGMLYRLQAVLDNLNAEHVNSGNLDATGHANFRIEPLVPEPHTAVLLAFAAVALIPRYRRDG